MSTAIERIDGYICKVESHDFDDLKDAAQMVGLPVYDEDDYDENYPYYAWDGSDICGYSSINNFELIPIENYIDKLRGYSSNMTKAEILERFNITVTD